MTTYFIIAGVIAGAVALVTFAIRRAGERSKELGRQEVINEVQHADAIATRKADIVLAEHRTVDDTASKLRDGNF